ncbi:MAG: polyphosphate glucokinase [Verrucomicrobiota bacterium]|jgi:polyphosphate glucokinase
MNVLVIDIGGTKVKVRSSAKKNGSFPSGSHLSPRQMVLGVKKVARDWEYDVVSIGYPAPVRRGQPILEPHNLGKGWVGFDFEAAFKRPVKLVNDAVLQALGSYNGGKMLFLGLGTGLGSCMVVDGTVVPMELAHLPYKKGTYEDCLGIRGLKKLGRKKWRKKVAEIVGVLSAALEPEDIVLGGGNVHQLDRLPTGCRAGDNANAFTGGVRLWKDYPTNPGQLGKAIPRRKSDARSKRKRR